MDDPYSKTNYRIRSLPFLEESRSPHTIYRAGVMKSKCSPSLPDFSTARTHAVAQEIGRPSLTILIPSTSKPIRFYDTAPP
jgi:hypothetical protein